MDNQPRIRHHLNLLDFMYAGALGQAYLTVRLEGSTMRGVFMEGPVQEIRVSAESLILVAPLKKSRRRSGRRVTERDHLAWTERKKKEHIRVPCHYPVSVLSDDVVWFQLDAHSVRWYGHLTLRAGVTVTDVSKSAERKSALYTAQKYVPPENGRPKAVLPKEKAARREISPAMIQHFLLNASTLNLAGKDTARDRKSPKHTAQSRTSLRSYYAKRKLAFV